jgi:PhoH-like ATPase
MAKKTYVLDTSALLNDSDCINSSFGNNDILIPLKVLEELDKHKKRQDLVGANSRTVIRSLDALRSKGSLYEGVRLGKGKGVLTVKGYNHSMTFPPDLDLTVPDHQILAVALSEKEAGVKVIVVSNDINMRVICDSIGMESQDMNPEKVVENSSNLYTGFADVMVDDEFIDRFYENENIALPEQKEKLYANQYLMLTSSLNNKKTALAKYIGHNKPLERLAQFNKKGVCGIKPRNKEQSFSIDLLMNPDIPLVSIVGKAGCGKTMLAIAAGLEQTIGIDNKYSRLIVSRPVQPMGKDIGFLPGTLEEKMSPWLRPIQDNLQFLMGNDKITLDMYMQKGVIEVEAITYIRGRSISNAYIIIDEAQNLSMHEIKTIITRVGENSKVVLTGDIEQIDNVYVDETTNGLTYVAEKFKPYDLAGHITLMTGERSKVATLASKIL